MKKQKKVKVLSIFFDFIKKFRWIDILGISIFLFILGISFFFFLRKENYIDVVLRISESQGGLTWGDKTPVWYLENLKPGMTQKDLIGKSIISIVDVKSFRTSEQNKIFFVNLRLRTTYTPRTKEYVFNGVPVLIGSYQTFNLNGVKLMGIIQKIGNTENNFPQKKIKIKGIIDPVFNEDYRALAGNTISDGIEKYISEMFKEGLTMEDSQQNVILEIKKINRSLATKQFIFQNRLIGVPDYDRDKVEMELEISVDEINGTYVFLGEKVIKVGTNFYLDFLQFGANFKVTSIDQG